MGLLVKPAGAPHSNVYSAFGARSLILACSSDSDLFAGFDRHPQVGFAQVVPLMLQLFLAAREESPERVLLAESLACEVAGRAIHAYPTGEVRPPRWLARTMELVRSGCDRPHTLKSLAANADVHPVYMARAFRRHVGCSVGEYMRSLRLSRAMRSLATSRTTISRMAPESGFTDHAHLSRTVTRDLGMTPSRFRELARRIAPMD
jgi:AraC family transcriptional regulator